MNKVENPQIEVPSTTEMNDRDCLNEILNCEKNLITYLATALNEASNEVLHNQLIDIMNDVRMFQRHLFELLFKNGWYSLEKAESQKISEKITEMTTKLTELV